VLFSSSSALLDTAGERREDPDVAVDEENAAMNDDVPEIRETQRYTNMLWSKV